MRYSLLFGLLLMSALVACSDSANNPVDVAGEPEPFAVDLSPAAMEKSAAARTKPPAAQPNADSKDDRAAAPAEPSDK